MEILCFGDSITFGEGDGKGWTGRIKEWFEGTDSKRRVYNLGIPGETSTDLIKRFDSECKARVNPNEASDNYIIFIAIGANDLKYKKNYFPYNTNYS
jgi:lysophospholipase L1-like esterase